jgi:hypothetical protein
MTTRKPDLLSRLMAEQHHPDYKGHRVRLMAAIARIRSRPISDEKRMYAEVREKVHLARLLREPDDPFAKELSQDDKNLFRWQAVNEARFRDRLSWNEAYKAASAKFARTHIAGRPSTMKWSYDQVQRIRKSRLKISF